MVSTKFRKARNVFIEFLLFLIGIALLCWALRSIDARQLRVLYPALLPWGWLVFFAYPLMCLWDVWAWKMSFGRDTAGKLSFGGLYAIRLAGEALNNVTPILDVGGEPLKAVLVSRQFCVSQKTALSACIIDRTALIFAEILLMLTGLALAVSFLPVGREIFLVLLLTASCLFAVAVGLLVMEQKGLLNREIQIFHAAEKKRFWACVLLHFVGWAAGGVETTLMCRLIGMPVSLWEGVMLEALLQLVRMASFFIPGNLGAQEIGLALFVRTMGFNPALGLALSLFKRLRQLLWTAAGFVVWAFYRAGPCEEDPSTLDTPLDRVIHRAPAKALAGLFCRTPVTPNQLTVLSLVAALASGFWFWRGSAAGGVLALFFFWLWAVLDHADGELARRCGKTSEFGRKLDDFCDNVSSCAIFWGIFAGLLPFWRAGDRVVLQILFFLGLAANTLSGAALLETKRRLRSNTLNHVTGRDLFYLLVILAAVTLWRKEAVWHSLTMGALIGGLYLTSAIFLAAWLKMSSHPVRD